MASVNDTRERLRALMLSAKRFAYFDHAAMAPLPRPTAEAFEKWLKEAVEIGGPVWGEWVRRVERMRRAVGHPRRVVRRLVDEGSLLHRRSVRRKQGARRCCRPKRLSRLFAATCRVGEAAQSSQGSLPWSVATVEPGWFWDWRAPA